MSDRLQQLRELRTTIDNQIAALEAAQRAEEARLARIRANVEAAAYVASICGTETGYYHHLRVTKTLTCEKCRAAHALAERRRVARRGAA